MCLVCVLNLQYACVSTPSCCVWVLCLGAVSGCCVGVFCEFCVCARVCACRVGSRCAFHCFSLLFIAFHCSHEEEEEAARCVQGRKQVCRSLLFIAFHCSHEEEEEAARHAGACLKLRAASRVGSRCAFHCFSLQS